MSSPEETAVRSLQDEIVACLNLRNYVIDVYYSNSNLSDNMCEYLLGIENQRQQNEAFLREVLQNGDVSVFIEALEFENIHKNLAEKVREKIAELRRSVAIFRDDGHFVMLPNPRKLDTRCGKMKKMVRLNFKLREITSQGMHGHTQFRHIIKSMRNRHQHDSDVLFHMLDAECAFLRVFYQQSVHQEQILNEMELLVDKTKHPTASRMVYLARKGSYIAMIGNLDMGQEYLKRAKTLADQLHPCKDTGMVQYVETNMLLKKYVIRPDPETKEKIFQNITHAVEYDFSEEDDSIREDYTKMMYLKLAFCYLGISCLCDVVPDWSVEVGDIRKTEDCLARVDLLPGQLYNRHLMFYCFARSVLFFKKGNKVDAVNFAKKAENVALESSYIKELENIQLYNGDISFRSIQEESAQFTYC